MGLDFYIKLENGKTISLDVRPFETIASVKKKIEDIKGIPTDQQLLIYQNQELKDNEKLSFYKINNVVKLLGKNKKIMIKMLNGSIITLEVSLTSTIHEVKSKIFQKENIPVDIIYVYLGDETMQLLYDQGVLYDKPICKKILQYGLIMRLFSNVDIKTIAGEGTEEELETPAKDMKINIEAGETFKDIKIKIQGRSIYIFATISLANHYHR